MDRPSFLFRQAQAAFDLIWLAQSENDIRLEHCGGRELVRVVRQNSCRFVSDSDANCYGLLASKVMEAAEDADLAILVLAANDLQRGLWWGDIGEFARFAEERIRQAPRKIRSAILRGLDTVEDLSLRHRPAEYILPKESRLTRDMDEILSKLLAVARNIDQQTLQSIAAADYERDVAKHLAALNEVIATENCQFPRGDVWFPSEVVELVAHVRSTTGFVNCTALLLANALPVNDEREWFPFRWHNLAKDYNTLPESSGATILAGLRYLHESGVDFLPYKRQELCDPVLWPEGMIHYESQPEAIICL